MKINVSHVAKLANLSLNDKEIKLFETQLEETINHVEELNKIDTHNVEPTNQVTQLENVLRDDLAKSSLSQEDALLNASSTFNGLFKVDAILTNE